MRIGIRTYQTEGTDLGGWVHLLQLGKEWNRTSHAIRFGLLTIIEVCTRLLDGVVKPAVELLPAPSLAVMATVNCDFGIVGDILLQFLLDDSVRFARVLVWRKPAREAHGSTRAAYIAGLCKVREATCPRDRKVGPPSVVQVQLGEVLLVATLYALMDFVLLVHGITSKSCHEFCLFCGPCWDLCSQLFAYLAC